MRLPFKTATKSIVCEIWKPFFLYQQKTEVPQTFYEGLKPDFLAGAKMQRRCDKYNRKRRIRQNCEPGYLTELTEKVRYGGNPEHKRNPGDFGLTPPSQPRPYKSLCDVVNIFSKREAIRLLKAGIEKGLISEIDYNGFPQNIWSVTTDGHPLEAQLENPEQGIYHGYPIPETDPFRDVVLECWER